MSIILELAEPQQILILKLDLMSFYFTLLDVIYESFMRKTWKCSSEELNSESHLIKFYNKVKNFKFSIVSFHDIKAKIPLWYNWKNMKCQSYIVIYF